MTSAYHFFELDDMVVKKELVVGYLMLHMLVYLAHQSHRVFHTKVFN